ncbi:MULTISPECIES: DUF2865 domain-containing protein [Bradyrhizobium]|jgi:hypothetical protein|uniref:DUF2865 domain-containing protein n=1 Tax=Bradyrhizobium elkanii TaxID=29448 RepID=A0ABV4ERU8_BRAEL|nr:DUF2865 domain-containing protein [Bradyrhizobium elkanii]MBP2429683.1 hypothetical protein [Bradyrhizobium elkanii]MCP1736845.1 hypothetical protein [Bradyrhizobium elkanii]MCP1754890.1 hypothetical protein [Bradyrhizobium elkanii]MCP1980408.1 hypothetical protein [Bradyrhizobium elkanii]MCS3572185.1 hypothetical protein [Bradyrhizobium elkanii]
MVKRHVRRWAFGTAALFGLSLAPAAQAQDFFSQLFGGFMHGRPPVIRMPFDDGPAPMAPRIERRPRYDVGQAYCVRTCDGRYFPLAATGNQSKAESCNSFCPASATEVVYGGNIDNAATEDGKPYSELPNAFRYRDELVSGCTCNGKDSVGLAAIKIEDDPTLRKGDIVAGKDGLMSVSRPDRRGAQLNFTPAPDRIRAKYGRPAVLARE